jgi:hypothetical protein
LFRLKELNPLDFTVDYVTDICEYNLDEEKKDLSGIDLEQAIIEFIDDMDINQKSDVKKYTIELLKRMHG